MLEGGATQRSAGTIERLPQIGTPGLTTQGGFGVAPYGANAFHAVDASSRCCDKDVGLCIGFRTSAAPIQGTLRNLVFMGHP